MRIINKDYESANPDIIYDAKRKIQEHKMKAAELQGISEWRVKYHLKRARYIRNYISKKFGIIID